jgi:hypothetical protein
MCAATVENGLVDFEQVETSALTGFPSQTALSEEKNLLRRKQSLLAYNLWPSRMTEKFAVAFRSLSFKHALL